jgi:hypothetical protein
MLSSVSLIVRSALKAGTMTETRSSSLLIPFSGLYV